MTRYLHSQRRMLEDELALLRPRAAGKPKKVEAVWRRGLIHRSPPGPAGPRPRLAERFWRLWTSWWRRPKRSRSACKLPSPRLVRAPHKHFPPSGADLPAAKSGRGVRPSPQASCRRHAARKERIYRRLAAAQLTGLCLSGGGIRSACFCLGVLQGLARKGWLRRFDYLSTVSGGGYIGAWLSAWCARRNRGNVRPNTILRVERWLAGRGLFPHASEPKEVSRLRDFTSYLTPRRGITSSDTWTAIAIVVRNLLLNWLLFLPLFLLLVWLPKATAVALQALRSHPLDLAFSFRSGPPALRGVFQDGLSVNLLPALAVLGIGLYAWVLYFMARQQIGRGNAGSATFLLNALLPFYGAAVFAAILFEHFRGILLSSGRIDLWWVGAAGGAALWLACFVLGGARDPGYVLARTAGGLVFGVALVAAARLMLKLGSFDDTRYAVVFVLPAFFLCHLAGNVVFIGASSRVVDHDEDREWSARANGWLVVIALVWLIYSAVVLWEPADTPRLQAWAADWHLGHLETLLAPLGGLAGLASALFAKRTSQRQIERDRAAGRTLPRLAWTRLALVGASFFFIVLMYQLSRWFDAVLLSHPLGNETKLRVFDGGTENIFIIVFVVLLAWLVLASSMINVNKFSLHAYYRNRLIRAYLGASHDKRKENPFTGFDEGDNCGMAGLLRRRPIHVVNMTLNLIRGQKLAWQERKASSFTVTQLAAGSAVLGYRPAGDYAKGITLGTAMTISGAALSPSMGYHSSPSLSFLMTLFNMRLGWWLGNPRDQGAWRKTGPTWSIFPILFELFGLTNEHVPYVYLSDGGHFDNLGLYEMLRRRCAAIVVIDSSCDSASCCEALGGALRRAQVDFGVRVAFDSAEPVQRGEGDAAAAAAPLCAMAEIAYPEGGSGRLFYIKPALHGDEPLDVQSYAALHPEFPHESTVDQFFTESQFESYRQLGLHIALKVFSSRRRLSWRRVSWHGRRAIAVR